MSTNMRSFSLWQTVLWCFVATVCVGCANLDDNQDAGRTGGVASDESLPPMARAMLESDLDTMRALLQGGFDPDAKVSLGSGHDDASWSALHIATAWCVGGIAMSKDEEVRPDPDTAFAIMEILLDAGADPNLREHIIGGTPIYTLASVSFNSFFMRSPNDINRLPKCMELLVRYGALVTTPDKYGQPPLIVAIDSGSQPAFAWLWSASDDPMAQQWVGLNPVEYSLVAYGHMPADLMLSPVARLLWPDVPLYQELYDTDTALANIDCNSSQMACAIDANDSNMVAKNLRDGADPGGALAGAPFVHLAMHQSDSGSCRPQILRLLLDAGADPDARDPNGFPAVHRAARIPDQACLQLLAEHGANLDVRAGKSQRTAYFGAVHAKNSDAVNQLWQQGADPMIDDRHGINALEYAVLRGGKYPDMMRDIARKIWHKRMKAMMDKRKSQSQHKGAP